MKILITAGNTQVPIDRVRCITSVFSGRTGTGLALHALERGHDVTLLTSHPELLENHGEDCEWLAFRTFADLEILMEQQIAHRPFAAVICCAAVSDFCVAGAFAPVPGTQFKPENGTWSAAQGSPALVERTGGKISSGEPELWLRLTPAPKLIDRIRGDWGFRGQLVKFKLEADLNSERLREIAEQSRLHSGADWMVANLYDGSLSSFHLGPLPGPVPCYAVVPRGELPARLFELLEAKHRERTHD
jgi:phosphopantothenate---cysteine ligase (CTP)